jgi:Phosphate-induced protein 1 conserved region
LRATKSSICPGFFCSFLFNRRSNSTNSEVIDMQLPPGKIRFASVLLFVILAVNFMAAQKPLPTAGAGDDTPDGKHGKSGQVTAAVAGPVGQAVVTGNGINYHGGPVLKANPVKYYLIWYGNWAGTGSNTAATVSLVEHFINTLGGTPIEHIATTYGDTTGNVSGNVTLGGATFVNSTRNLTDARLQTTVGNAISSGALPNDPNGVYFVLSSSNINETSGFCTQYCGFHTHATLSGSDIKYAFVGNPDRCPSGCEIQPTGPNSPAANVGGADGLINVLSHEQFEAITDPDLNAWFDASGQEDSDKCNFNFGTTSTCTSTSICSAAGKAAAAKFNVTFGSNDWMIQQQWENAAGGKCVLHL